MSDILNNQKAKISFSTAMVMDKTNGPNLAWSKPVLTPKPRGNIDASPEGAQAGLISRGFSIYERSMVPSTVDSQILGAQNDEGVFQTHHFGPRFSKAFYAQAACESLARGGEIPEPTELEAPMPIGAGIYPRYHIQFQEGEPDLDLLKAMEYVFVGLAEAHVSETTMIRHSAKTLKQLKDCMENFVFTNGTMQGMLDRFEQMRFIREGLGGFVKKKSLSEMGLTTETTAQVLEVYFPINRVDVSKHQPLKFKPSSRVTKSHPKFFGEEVLSAIAASDPDKASFLSSLQDCEWPDLPRVRPSALAGMPFKESATKGDTAAGALLLADKLYISVMSNLKEGKLTNKKYQEIFQEFWYLWVNYIFPKAEVYEKATVETKTRNISASPFPVFILGASITEPLLESPTPYNYITTNGKVPSLYRFNPFNGNMMILIWLWIIKGLRAIEADPEKPEPEYLVYADNVYVIHYVKDARKAGDLVLFIKMILNTFTSTPGASPDEAAFLNDCLSLVEQGYVIEYASADLTKGEANATPDRAQAVLYYMLTRGWVDNTGQPLFDQAWAALATEILPTMIVDSFGLMFNSRFKIPGQGSGNFLTFQINHLLSAQGVEKLKAEGNPLPYTPAFLKCFRDVGIECKVEYYDDDLLKNLLMNMADAYRTEGFMYEAAYYSEEKSAAAFADIDCQGPTQSLFVKLDLLGWGVTYLPRLGMFVPVLDRERLLKSAAHPKRMKQRGPQDPETLRASANKGGLNKYTRDLVFNYARYAALLIEGAWSVPALFEGIRLRIKRITTALKSTLTLTDDEDVKSMLDLLASEDPILKELFSSPGVSFSTMMQAIGGFDYSILPELLGANRKEYEPLKPPTRVISQPEVYASMVVLRQKLVYNRADTDFSSFVDAILPISVAYLSGAMFPEVSEGIQQAKNLTELRDDLMKVEKLVKAYREIPLDDKRLEQLSALVEARDFVPIVAVFNDNAVIDKDVLAEIKKIFKDTVKAYKKRFGSTVVNALDEVNAAIKAASQVTAMATPRDIPSVSPSVNFVVDSGLLVPASDQGRKRKAGANLKGISLRPHVGPK